MLPGAFALPILLVGTWAVSVEDLYWTVLRFTGYKGTLTQYSKGFCSLMGLAEAHIQSARRHISQGTLGLAECVEAVNSIDRHVVESKVLRMLQAEYQTFPSQCLLRLLFQPDSADLIKAAVVLGGVPPWHLPLAASMLDIASWHLAPFRLAVAGVLQRRFIDVAFSHRLIPEYGRSHMCSRLISSFLHTVFNVLAPMDELPRSMVDVLEKRQFESSKSFWSAFPLTVLGRIEQMSQGILDLSCLVDLKQCQPQFLRLPSDFAQCVPVYERHIKISSQLSTQLRRSPQSMAAALGTLQMPSKRNQNNVAITAIYLSILLAQFELFGSLTEDISYHAGLDRAHRLVLSIVSKATRDLVDDAETLFTIDIPPGSLLVDPNTPGLSHEHNAFSKLSLLVSSSLSSFASLALDQADFRHLLVILDKSSFSKAGRQRLLHGLRAAIDAGQCASVTDLLQMLELYRRG